MAAHFVYMIDDDLERVYGRREYAENIVKKTGETLTKIRVKKAAEWPCLPGHLFLEWVEERVPLDWKTKSGRIKEEVLGSKMKRWTTEWRTGNRACSLRKADEVCLQLGLSVNDIPSSLFTTTRDVRKAFV